MTPPQPQPLPGMSLIAAPSNGPGEVETEVKKQLEQLRNENLLTAAHAGRAALAVRAARDVDQSAGIGAPSGRANLLRVLNEILEGLPTPETESTSVLDSVTAFITTGQLEARP